MRNRCLWVNRFITAHALVHKSTRRFKEMFYRQKRKFTGRLTVLAATLATALCSTAQAEFFGLNNGRIGKFDTSNPLSIEFGLVTGKFAKVDYDNPTLRLNYSVSNNIQVFADLSKTSVGSDDETGFGVGVFYGLGKLFDFSETVTLKGSLHSAKLNKYVSGGFTTDCSGPMPIVNPYDGTITIDPGYCYPVLLDGSSSTDTIKAFSMEVLIGGKPIKNLEVKGQYASWYLNAGVNSFHGSNLGSEFSAGGGLVLPIGPGEAYAGVDIISEVLLGIGYRYNLKN